VKPMAWHQAEVFVEALDSESRATLLRILTAGPEVRADAIGRLHARAEGTALAELLIELEEHEWARQWFVERLGGEGAC
jgi:hypothetical protein